MIVCLCGPTCTGKTTIAEIVAEQLKLSLRSCGDVIRKRAASQQVALKDLPDETHREVDQETIEWALANQPCLVEGRFLDTVFSGNSPDVIVRLQATDDARLQRGRMRRGDFELADLQRYDQDDQQFLRRVYPARTPLDCIDIDTSNLSVDECVECVRSIINKRLV